MKPLADCKLYTFVDTAYLQGRAPELVAQQLCDGGSDLIQLRAKNSSSDEIRRMAERILPITKRADVGLVINDHLEIARELGAEFCHLGQEDFFDAGFTHVSQLSTINSQLKIGLSTHSPEQAQRALAAGPDYIAIGPVFATGTKPGAKPVTLDYVRWAAVNATVPWFAIGGVNLETIDAVLAAGAKRVCVVSAILNAPDVTKACAEFRRKIDNFETVQDLIGQTTELIWSFTIWWELVNKEKFDQNFPPKQAYPNFFMAIAFSLLQGLCIITYRLLESDRKGETKSLYKIVEGLKSSNLALSQKLNSRIEANRETLKKIFSIRNNVYGHRNDSKSPQGIFAKAGITPNEIKPIVGLIQEIVIALAETWGVETRLVLEDKFRRCEQDVCYETEQILRILREHSS